MDNVENFCKMVFPNITNENEYFPKYTKKIVSEDFIAENFREKGWSVFTPYDDTGIDMVITKTINTNDGTPKKMTRFIQLKTRALVPEDKDGVFNLGYVLSLKDFRDDPRGVIILFNDDNSITGKYDCFIIPMYNYIKFFYDNSSFSDKNKNTFGDSHFSTKAFRNENNKINNLHYHKDKKTFVYNSKANFNIFSEMKGYNLMASSDIDDNFEKYKEEINTMKNNLLYHKKDYSSDEDKELKIIFSDIKKETNNDRKNRFDSIKKSIDSDSRFTPEIMESIKKYNKTARGLD